MDKTVDSGSIDVGSIPTRDAKMQAQAGQISSCLLFLIAICQEWSNCFVSQHIVHRTLNM
jgi:hypothetical protein